MDIKHTIKDNYLNEVDYENLQNIIMGDEFPWYFHKTVSSRNDNDKTHFFATHMFFMSTAGITSSFYKILNPIIEKLKCKSLMRIKANLYSNQSKIEEHQKHIDYPFQHKTALFSLNTCNGFTKLVDGTKIKSIGNRMLFFDSSIPHQSSTCTDEMARININFNYF